MRAAAFLVASVAGASVPGVPDSVGYLSTTHTIPTPLDNRTNGTGAATRYSLMLEGCCGWSTYNLSAPQLLHTEIDPEGSALFDLSFTYDKLYDFFGGDDAGKISWWWAEYTHGVRYCVEGDGEKLFLAACDDDDRGPQTFERRGGSLAHRASGTCLHVDGDMVCSGQKSSGCIFLEGPASLRACTGRAAQLWDFPRRAPGLDAALAAIANGTRAEP